MVELDMLRAIADDLSKSEWCMGLSAALHKTLEDIARETEDISGYESDVLAWVEKNGGLEAVKERTMPEDMSWPFYEDGEPVRLGEHWQQDGYDWSITSIDSIEFAEDGVRFENEYADAFYRYGERVKRPASKVYDADGVEIREGDTVWSLGGGGPYTVAGFDGGTPYVLCDDGAGNVPALEPSALTHRAPVIASDGKPLEVGQTVYHIADGKEYTVEELFKYGAMVTHDGITGGRCRADYLTHERPDSFSLIEQDAELCPYDYAMKYGKPDGVSSGKFQRVDLVRRARALAEKED